MYRVVGILRHTILKTFLFLFFAHHSFVRPLHDTDVGVPYMSAYKLYKLKPFFSLSLLILARFKPDPRPLRIYVFGCVDHRTVIGAFRSTKKNMTISRMNWSDEWVFFRKANYLNLNLKLKTIFLNGIFSGGPWGSLGG